MTATLGFAAQLLTFRRRLVRDLAWTILLPPVVIARRQPVGIDRRTALYGWCDWGIKRPVVVTEPGGWFSASAAIDAFERCEPALRHLDRNEDAYETFRARLEPFLGGRLGILHERLVVEWLRIDPRYELVAHDVQVRTGKQTVGQIDFLVRLVGGDCDGHDVEHWETAVKFYLQTGRVEDLDRWVGTDLNDRLDRKAAHLLGHQATITSTAAGSAELHRRNLPQPQRSRVLLRGVLFAHVSGPETVTPLAANREQPGGWWMSPEAFLARSWEEVDCWIVAFPEQWFSPATDEDLAPEQRQYASADAVIDEVRSDVARRPILVVALRDGMEWTRGFLFDRRFAV